MRILALDLSKSSTGWAVWGPDDAHVASGHWVLGSEFTSRGRAFAKLHEKMTDLHSIGAIDAVFYEQPMNMAIAGKMNDFATPMLLMGLAAHAESWGEAMGCRIIRDVHMATWRRHFIGSIKRGTRKADLKSYVLQRCRELGFNPRRDDESDAIGILDYACDALGIFPYWRQANPLVQQFGGRAR